MAIWDALTNLLYFNISLAENIVEDNLINSDDSFVPLRKKPTKLKTPKQKVSAPLLKLMCVYENARGLQGSTPLEFVQSCFKVQSYKCVPAVHF